MSNARKGISMRNRAIIALVMAAGCASPTAPHVQGIGGGSSTSDLLAFVTQPSTAVAGIQIAPAGVATFSDLSVNPAGVGYALRASVAGLTAVTSGSFDISAAAVSARRE
jgi:hypothetical protein